MKGRLGTSGPGHSFTGVGFRFRFPAWYYMPLSSLVHKLERHLGDFFAMDLREIGKIPIKKCVKSAKSLKKYLRFCVSKPL